MVQREAPSGGVEQTIAQILASTSPVTFRCRFFALFFQGQIPYLLLQNAGQFQLLYYGSTICFFDTVIRLGTIFGFLIQL